MFSSKKFLSKEEQKTIIEAIQAAEKETSGEIKVHIEKNFKDDEPLTRAQEVFAKLNMHKTEQRNGVLFYIAVDDKQFAIYADKGINEKVDVDFWNEVRNVTQAEFRKGNFVKGIADGVALTGKSLKTHFPYQLGDINELPDDISFG